MRREDFGPRSPGRLINSIEGFLTFVPNPLPPEFELTLSLINVLSEADRCIGELAGVGQLLPNPHLLISTFLRREAVLSSRIEGTIANLQQLLLFEEAEAPERVTGDVREVHNYVTALEYGLHRLSSLPVSLRLIREMHEILLRDVRGSDQHPGEFRRIQNFIGRRGGGIESATYVPPSAAELNESLYAFERFLSTGQELPFLIQLALMHYQFEAIHPFVDGNGRIGRLLIPLLLCERGILPQPLLYLSDYLERNRTDYFAHLLSVSQRGTWGEWIEFFLRGVIEQTRETIDRTNRLLRLWSDYREILQSEAATGRVLNLLDALFERPTITIHRAAERLGITRRAAQLIVERFEGMGLLVEVTGRQRNRMYLAMPIYEILEARSARAEI